jgi:hypothetical protein
LQWPETHLYRAPPRQTSRRGVHTYPASIIFFIRFLMIVQNYYVHEARETT